MENKPKETSVKMLFDTVRELRVQLLFDEITLKDYNESMENAFIDASNLHKKEIMLAYCLGHVFHDSNDENAAEFYYNTEYAKTTNN